MDGSVRLVIFTAILVVYMPVTTLQGTTTYSAVSSTTTTETSVTTSQTSMSTQETSPSNEPEPSSVTSDTMSTTQPSTTTSPSSPPPTTTSTTPSGRCRLSRECERGAYCIMSRCTCVYGYYRRGTQCVATLPVGSNCTHETQCMTPSTCNDSVCTCPEEYYQKNQQCEKRVQVGEMCTNESQCVANAGCSSNTCRCLTDFFQKDMECIPTLPVGSNCTNETQCMTPSTCHDSVCTCPEEYYQMNQQCKHRVQVGEMCTNESQCVANAGCSSNTCRCLTDFFQKDMECIPRVSPGGQCNNQTSCVQNADCLSSNNTCQCKQGWMVNGSICSPKETRYVENLNVSRTTSSSVLVRFDGPLDYNMFKLDVNTSTPRCIVLRRNTSQEHCTECTVTDIEPSGNKRVQYNVTGLKAFTLYEMKVAMVKCINGSPESSRPATETARTDTAVPNVVRYLPGTTCRNASCLVCAEWEAPSPDPGPVTYSVDIFDEVNKKVLKETNETAASICYTEDDVGHFLRYTIGVSAFTTAGQGMEQRTASREINFLEFKIFTADGECSDSYNTGTQQLNYRQMRIQWPEPNIGTTITSYLVTTRNNGNTKSDNVTSKTALVTVTPGQTYTFKIQVRHNGTLYNVSSESRCRAPIGVPPKWPKDLEPSYVTTDSQVQLDYFGFLNNDTNGPITKGYLYISKNKKRLEVSDAQARQMTVTRIECCSGGFLGCKTGYCRNGLAPDTVYYYLAVVCTKRGCTQSPIFPFRTDKDNTTTIIVVMLVMSVIFAAAIIGAALFWRSKKSDMMPVRISLRKPDLSRIPRKRPMLLSEMENRVTQMHADSNLGFSEDYENIIRISPKHTNHASQIDENKQKNRWVNVLPFDHSRVILQVIDDDETSDYINASYMPGYNHENEYIASQGPLPGTVDDFWRMIWEKKVSIIVMVTPVKENGKVKCEEYWPAEVQEPKEYGDIVVENTSFSSLNTYNVTVFQLRNGQDKDVRVVKHFHFLNWKDMSADVERSDILDFVRTVRSHLRPDMGGPIVVHCSAGVGRTGTFICLDYLIQFIEKHDLSDTVDIYGYVMKLRNNRVLMVQTETQYVFIHDCAKQLVEEKRLALERPDSVVDVDEDEDEGEGSEDEDEDAVYVNTEMGVPVMNDGMAGTEMTTCKDKTGDGCDLYENTSTCRLIQQTEL